MLGLWLLGMEIDIPYIHKYMNKNVNTWVRDEVQNDQYDVT